MEMGMDAAPTRVATARKPTARAWSGVIIGVAGGVLAFLGWYGVAGQSSVAEQMPYLASATIPGAALLVVGALLLAQEHDAQKAERLVTALYELLTEPVSDEPAQARTDRHVVALPGTKHYHYASCALVAGKADASPVDAGEIAARALQPCPLCILGEPAA
jgi:multisubunit Na+/H+ antiporter MnhG subunit